MTYNQAVETDAWKGRRCQVRHFVMAATPLHPSSRALSGAFRALLLGLGLVLTLGWSALAAAPAVLRPPAELNVTANTAQVTFPDEILFRLIASDPGSTIERVRLLYSLADSPVLLEASPTFRPGRTVEAEFRWPVRQVLVPGSEINYYWKVETVSGNQWTTEPQQVAFDDTRFDWRKTTDGFITLHSYAPGEAASQALLQEIRAVLGLLQQEYSLTLEKQVKIFVYADQQDYVIALAPLQVVSSGLTIGTDRIFMLMTDQPEANAQTIRHEVLHAVFLQRTQNAFNAPPRWLTEGFSLFLAGDEIAPENIDALRQLDRDGQLFSLRSLNGSFPATEQELTIAYVESYSALRYIVEEFGAQKLKALLAAIREGNATDDAFERALGVTVGELDERWRAALQGGAQSGPSTAPRAGVAPDASESADGMLARTMGFWGRYLGPLGRPVLIGLVVAAGVITVIGFRSSRRRKSGENGD